MIYCIIFAVVVYAWIAYEFYTAPMYDENGNIKKKN